MVLNFATFLCLVATAGAVSVTLDLFSPAIIEGQTILFSATLDEASDVDVHLQVVLQWLGTSGEKTYGPTPSVEDVTIAAGDTTGKVSFQTAESVYIVKATSAQALVRQNSAKVNPDDLEIAGGVVAVEVDQNEEDKATITANNVTGTETDGALVFQMTASRITTETLVVIVTPSSETAFGSSSQPEDEFADFLDEQTQVTFPASEAAQLITTRPFNVFLLNDDIQEPTKHFKVDFEVEAPEDLKDRFVTTAAYGFLTDDEIVTVTLPPLVVSSEGDGEMQFPVTMSHVTEENQKITASFVDGSAKVGEDFTVDVGVVNIPGGRSRSLVPQCPSNVGSPSSNCMFSVKLIEDDLLDVANIFEVQLDRDSSFDPPVLITGESSVLSSTGKIEDDEPVVISVTDVTGKETDGNFVFNVILSHSIKPGQSIQWTATTVAYTATDEDVGQSNLDFTETTKTFNMTGNDFGSIDVPIHDDIVQEADEEFYLTLQLEDGFPISFEGDVLRGTGRLVDDAECPTLEIKNGVWQQNGTNMERGHFGFEIHLSHAFQRAVVPLRQDQISSASVFAQTRDGTAIAGLDFVAKSELVRFPFLSKLETFLVEVIGDTTMEDDENFFVDISDAKPVAEMCNPAITTSEGVAIIEDDDSPLFIQITGGRGLESAGILEFGITIVDGNGEEKAAQVDMTFQAVTRGCVDVFNCDGRATGRNTDGSRSSRRGSISVFDQAILDYGSISTEAIVVSAGASKTTFQVPLNDDRIVEPEQETFDVTVRSLQAFFNITEVTHVASIESEDKGTVVIQDGVAQDTSSVLTYEFSFAQLVEGEVAIVTEVVGGTAASGVDFVGDGAMDITVPTYACNPISSGIVDFDCTMSITLIPTNDGVVDTGPATTIVNKVVSVLTGTAELFPATRSTIVSPDPQEFTGSVFHDAGGAGVLSITNVVVGESAGSILFPVLLSAANLVEVKVATSFTGLVNSNAPAAGCFEGADFDLPSTCVDGVCEVTFEACPSVEECTELPRRAGVTVEIIDDPISEAKVERVQVTLESVLEPPGGVVVISEKFGQAFLSITDNDDADVSVSNPEAVESAGELNFIITLSKAVDLPVEFVYTMNYCTAQEIATGVGACAFGSTSPDPVDSIYPDFKIPAGSSPWSVTMQQLKKETVISVALYDDPVQECDELFEVSIDAVVVDGAGAADQYRVGAQPMPITAEGTILTDDEGLTLTFSNNVTGNSSDSPFVFTVSVSHLTSNAFNFVSKGTNVDNAAGRFFEGDISVPVQAMSQPADYSVDVTITENGNSQNGTFSMTVESLAVVSANGCKYPFTSPAGSGIGNIVGDGSSSNSLSFASPVVEGAAPSTLNFEILVDGGVAESDIEFSFYTSDGTALAGIDYQAKQETIRIPKGDSRVLVGVNLLSRGGIVTPQTEFTATITSNVASVINGTAAGIRQAEGSALFYIDDAEFPGTVVEGESYTMAVTLGSNIQADSVEMELETDTAAGCEINCALGGIDYVWSVHTVTWSSEPGGDGVVFADSVSSEFTVQTLVDPATTATLAFSVKVNSITASPGQVGYEDASFFTKDIHIETVEQAPWVTSWNCPPPFKYVSEGVSAVSMILTTTSTVDFGNILPVYQDLKPCFGSQNNVTYNVLPKAGTPLEVDQNGILMINYNNFLEFNPNDYWLTIFATDDVTGNTSSFRSYIKLSITETKYLEDIKKDLQSRRRNVMDYFAYQIAVPKALIDYDGCKKVIGSNNRLSNEPNCCTTQNILGANRDTYPDGVSNVGIVTCYVLPVRDYYFYDLMYYVNAVRPGKSTACVGASVTDEDAQCFELFTYGVQTVNWIPDQYVVLEENGAWELSLPITVDGVRSHDYTLEFLTGDGVTATSDGFQAFTLTGSTVGQFQVNVISHAVAASDESATKATKGRTFWVYVFQF